MTEKKFKHLNIQVKADLYDEFKELVPWGLRGHLFDTILRLIMSAIREDGHMITGALLAGEYKLSLSKDRSSIKGSGDD